ncbi:MAG: zinc ribbon domain-containing protein [Candidatus Schekmanbacteria bacterium]|nr:zinc ribbon domain-containing protein [Candidatus Schekmanbacteria bacterium]
MFCFKCGAPNGDGATFCNRCGTRLTAGPPTSKSRHPSILLAIGIVFCPFVFAWATLRRGHSNLSRALALGWLGLNFFVLMGLGTSQTVRPPQTARGREATARKHVRPDLGQAPARREVEDAPASPEGAGELSRNAREERSAALRQASPPPAAPPRPAPRTYVRDTCADVARVFSASGPMTDLQKKEAWKQYSGKWVSWTGTVGQVSEGLLGGLSVHVKCLETTLTSDAHIAFGDAWRARLTGVNEGRAIQFRARLRDYNQLLGLSLNDGELQ